MQTETVMDNPYVQNEMKPGEHLLWWGKPNLAHRVKNNSAIYINTIILGVLAVFTLGLIFNAWNLLNEEIGFGEDLRSSSLFLLIFSIVLFIICITRLLIFYNQIRKNVTNLRNTTYAITDQRIFVVTTIGAGFGVKSHTRNDIGQLVRMETGGGWGDVSYGIPRTQHAGFRTVSVVDKLVGVPNARMVEDILIRTFKNSQPSPAQAWYPPQPAHTQPYPPQPQYYPQSAQPQAPTVQPPSYPPLPQYYEQPASEGAPPPPAPQE